MMISFSKIADYAYVKNVSNHSTCEYYRALNALKSWHFKTFELTLKVDFVENEKDDNLHLYRADRTDAR